MDNKKEVILFFIVNTLISGSFGFMCLLIGFEYFEYEDFIAYSVWLSSGFIFFTIFNILRKNILSFFATRAGKIILKTISILFAICIILSGMIGILCGGMGILEGPGSRGGYNFAPPFFLGFLMFIGGLVGIYYSIMAIKYVINKNNF